MTAPTLYPSKYSGTAVDYNRAKIDRSGALRTEAVTVTVPSSTASGTVIGLVPFRKGARFVCNASGVFTTDIDTGTTVNASVGYVYDDNVTYTNAPAAFVSASTVPQTGGIIPVTGLATAYTFVAAADGWITVTTGGGTTTTAGTISAQITLAYDGLV